MTHPPFAGEPFSPSSRGDGAPNRTALAPLLHAILDSLFLRSHLHAIGMVGEGCVSALLRDAFVERKETAAFARRFGARCNGRGGAFGLLLGGRRDLDRPSSRRC